MSFSIFYFQKNFVPLIFNQVKMAKFKIQTSSSNVNWTGKKVLGLHTGSINIANGFIPKISIGFYVLPTEIG
jgi:hypothetical protein